MNNLANTLSDRGRLDEAEKMEHEVLDLWLEILGPRHTHTISAMYNLGVILFKRAQLDNAQKRTPPVMLKIFGRDHLATSSGPSETFRESDWLGEARKSLQEGVNLRVEVLGEGHPKTLKSKMFLERIISKQSLEPRRHVSRFLSFLS
ncbi:hypothetical protein PIIN_11357 [Serendipita indica DSM 11827]|uniref:Kinesin light chain n=1 Tax=Serendipita indica (strain DSM 11827) TaxID=1109443 RepID=G4U1D7_SERID|nr:hypothetical protein PIIN_11357 [Serendipita indica DSM 11827]